MQTSTDKALDIYELLERIIFELGDPSEIIKTQRVCRRWRTIIQDSSRLHEACWYKSLDRRQEDDQQTFRLNPVFGRLDLSLMLYTRYPHVNIAHEYGLFNLKKRIYDKPGSWTTMLATHPPCKRVAISCVSDYGSGDETMTYIVESTSDDLLMGDIMAVLAECQNRQECGIDRLHGIRHVTGHFRALPEKEWHHPDNKLDYRNWQAHLQSMPSGVSINVAVFMSPTCDYFPGLSLRRVYPDTSHDYNIVSGKEFLHELIVHRMIDQDGAEYKWEFMNNILRPMCEGRKYDANLVAVKEHPEGYIGEYSRTLPSLSDLR